MLGISRFMSAVNPLFFSCARQTVKHPVEPVAQATRKFSFNPIAFFSNSRPANISSSPLAKAVDCKNPGKSSGGASKDPGSSAGGGMVTPGQGGASKSDPTQGGGAAGAVKPKPPKGGTSGGATPIGKP